MFQPGLKPDLNFQCKNLEICNFHWKFQNPKISTFEICEQARNGDDRVRTDGLRSASAALSQLSYIPSTKDPLNMGLGRVELPTSRLSGVRSNHLSYRPDGVRLGKFKKGLAWGYRPAVKRPRSGVPQQSGRWARRQLLFEAENVPKQVFESSERVSATQTYS